MKQPLPHVLIGTSKERLVLAEQTSYQQWSGRGPSTHDFTEKTATNLAVSRIGLCEVRDLLSAHCRCQINDKTVLVVQVLTSYGVLAAGEFGGQHLPRHRAKVEKSPDC